MSDHHLTCKYTEKFDVTRLWGVGAWKQFQEDALAVAKAPKKTKIVPRPRAEHQIEENIIVAKQREKATNAAKFPSTNASIKTTS
jgi:hypothetical protein